MENSLYIALSRQQGLRNELDAVAHNIANMNTSGFKGSRMMFREYLYVPRQTEPYASVLDAATVTDFSEGPLQTTGNMLDVAINGPGFFQVQTSVGTRYTRAGHFRLNNDSELVTQEGYQVLGRDGAPIILPGEGLVDVTISSDGTVSALAGALNANNQQAVGQIGVFDFEDLQQLTHTEGGYYLAQADPQEIERPTLVQGSIEQSNVQGVVELTRMMGLLREYQGQQRLVDSENDRIRQLIRSLAGLQQS